MTHSQLVEVAAEWLKKRCSVVITELQSAGTEQPDAIGWQGCNSILVECKISRTDFDADRRKFFRQNPVYGVGRHRYFLTPCALISLTELPDKWGLLELIGGRLRIVRQSDAFAVINYQHEIAILLSCTRRIGVTSPKGVSIRCYTHETQNRATLSVQK